MLHIVGLVLGIVMVACARLRGQGHAIGYHRLCEGQFYHSALPPTGECTGITIIRRLGRGVPNF